MQPSQFSEPPDIRNWHDTYVYESYDSEYVNTMVRNFQHPKRVTAVHNDTDSGADERRRSKASRTVHPSDGGADASIGGRSSRIVHRGDVGAATSRGNMSSQVPQPIHNKTPSRGNRSSSDPVTVVDSTSGAPENDVDEPISTQKKGVRGPTTLRAVINLPKGTKLQIGWGGIRGGPTGEWAAKLGSFCGLTARNRDYIPLQLEGTFHNFLKETKFTHDDGTTTNNRKFLFDIVSDRFDIHESDSKMEVHVIRSIAKSYSQHLYDLKKDYFMYKTVQERQKVPPHVDAQDWLFLLSKWNSDKFKATSARNTENRANAVVVHGTGSRSHDRVFDDLTKKNGVEPTEYEFYEHVHTDKSGNSFPMDTTTASIMSAVKEKRARAEEDGTPENDDEVYKQMRPLKSKKKTFRSNPEDAARIDELTKKLEERDAAIDALTQTCGTLKNQVGAVFAAIRHLGIEIPTGEVVPPGEVVGSDDETQET